MVRIAQLLALSALLFAVPASAQHNPRHHGGGQGHTSHGNGHGYGHYEDGNPNGGGGGTEVPELDPKSGASAFALLAGLALLAGSRKRRSA